MKIGFFDSGVGGFAILSAVRRELGMYDYIYYGDTANLPYGDKNEEEVYTFTLRGVEELFSRDVNLVIIACNTASAETLRRMQDTLIPHIYADRRLLGVIIPTVETMLAKGTRKALLIATRRTVSSQKYDKELEKRNVDIDLTSIATPELVPLLENGQMNDAMLYLEKMVSLQIGEVDTIVLGCTHYVLLKGFIRKRFPHLTVISQDEIIPLKLKAYLEQHPEIESKLSRGASLEIILTKDSKEYRDKMESIFTV